MNRLGQMGRATAVLCLCALTSACSTRDPVTTDGAPPDTAQVDGPSPDTGDASALPDSVADVGNDGGTLVVPITSANDNCLLAGPVDLSPLDNAGSVRIDLDPAGAHSDHFECNGVEDVVVEFQNLSLAGGGASFTAVCQGGGSFAFGPGISAARPPLCGAFGAAPNLPCNGTATTLQLVFSPFAVICRSAAEGPMSLTLSKP